MCMCPMPRAGREGQGEGQAGGAVILLRNVTYVVDDAVTDIRPHNGVSHADQCFRPN